MECFCPDRRTRTIATVCNSMINVIIFETACFGDHIPAGPVFIKDFRLPGSKAKT